jgi:superoxide dismutase
MPFDLPPPPYPLDGLAPHMSKATLEYHWGAILGHVQGSIMAVIGMHSSAAPPDAPQPTHVTTTCVQQSRTPARALPRLHDGRQAPPRVR